MRRGGTLSQPPLFGLRLSGRWREDGGTQGLAGNSRGRGDRGSSGQLGSGGGISFRSCHTRSAVPSRWVCVWAQRSCPARGAEVSLKILWASQGSQIFIFLSFTMCDVKKTAFPGDVVFSVYLRNCHRKSSLWWFWLRGCYIFPPSREEAESRQRGCMLLSKSVVKYLGISLVVLLSFYFKKLGERIARIIA